MEEFVKEIPETPEGKLKAMNKLLFNEESPEEALKQTIVFFKDLMGNCPEYFEALQGCKTEEEIKNKSKHFFENNPKIIDETILSMLAVKRDRWEERERKKNE